MDLLERIEQMRVMGVHKTDASLLSALHKEAFGIDYRQNCNPCTEKAYNDLVSYAKKRATKPIQMGQYQFKDRKTKLPFRVKGRMIFLTNDNLTDENAALLIGTKYAHLLEKNTEAVIVHAEPPAEPVVLEVGDIFTEESTVESPNVETQSEQSTASTLTEAQTGGKKQTGRRGRPARV